MERIIALDPGGTTGWAMWTKMYNYVPGSGQYLGEDDKFSWGQLGPHEHHEELFALLEHMHVQEYTIVCESFEFRQYRQRENINLMSREYIGVVKLFRQQRSEIASFSPVVFQTAGQAKGFVSDEKLKAIDLYPSGQKHARDALRHLIYYMVNKRKRYDIVKNWRDL